MKIVKLLVLLLLPCCNIVREEIKLGAEWIKIGGENSFTPRRNFGTAVVDNKIIVIGGYIWKDNREELANDVWISEDEGKSWEEIKPHTDSPTETFSKRQKFGTVVIGQDIYIIGGYSDSGDHLNDVWKSFDLGKTWFEVTKNSCFSPRYGHKAVVINNDIYVIGGYDGGIYFNEVWKSTDLGKTWIKLDNIPFKEREGFGAVNYKNELMIIGGRNRESLTDIWRTEQQGQRWFKQLNAPFEFFEHEMVEVSEDLFVIEQDHVWKSIDEGQTWIKVIFEIPFEERAGYGMVNIGRKLIIFGGQNPKNGKYLNDVWESDY